MAPMYNLPYNFEGPIDYFDELLGYLSRIAASGRSVSVSVGRPPARFPYFQARGKLHRSDDFTTPSQGLFAINTSTSRDEGGELTLDEKQFRRGRLTTDDGDDYFTLVIEMEAVVIHMQDTNYP
jgi:hypothetical protein